MPAKSVIRFEQHIREIIKKDHQIIIFSECDAYWQGNHVFRTKNLPLTIETVYEASAQMTGGRES